MRKRDACAAELGEPGASWPAVAAAWDAIGAEFPACHAKLRAAEQAAAAREWTEARQWLRAAAEQASRVGAGRILAEVELLASRPDLAVWAASTFATYIRGHQAPSSSSLPRTRFA